MAARRSASSLLAVVLLLAAVWAASLAFVAPPADAPRAPALRSAGAAGEGQAAAAAALGAALAAAPEAAHAANQGYAVLQLGWAVFIIGLGPAVLFWIYFNKP
eukprot:CAMPEP_0115557694 /NCGR_PEP_ID=MMETSP0271-20121206/99046_1 /TAXON_ID=71861 /ORGANISM="Scrippsiella trochoidea, Strain CCMP3099" /LENGTH=102 /DNA_ID=CAMNT_0002991669 /DNA_START=87 /DNA_END=391 /DNA_ORIENTATION=+